MTPIGSTAAITATATANENGYILSGKKPFVNDAAAADYLLLAVQGPTGLGLAVGKEEVRITPQPMDGAKPMAGVDLEGVQIAAEVCCRCLTINWLT